MSDARYPTSSTQSGNVFLIVLLGVVLFAALAYVVARGMRSETTTGMSQRQAELVAVDVLSYAQRVERAVAKLRTRGVSENDIDFTNEVVTGYDHTPVQPENHMIFHKQGGGVQWQKPPAGVNDGSPWLFTGETCIPNVGTGAAGCDSDSANNEELLAVLPNVKQSVCHEINKRLGISPMPSGGGYSASKFTGAFSDDAAPGTDGSSAACFQVGSDYHFYSVLMAR